MYLGLKGTIATDIFKKQMKINVFWFRRDLRMEDNTGLSHALNSGLRVLPLFIFDTNITEELPGDDHRISFIYETIASLNRELEKMGSSLSVKKGDPLRIWEKLIREYEIESVFLNKDYEPYAIKRDERIKSFLNARGINFMKFKDQVIFEKNEVVKSDGTPYTVFTPYSRVWKKGLTAKDIEPLPSENHAGNFLKRKPSRIPAVAPIISPTICWTVWEVISRPHL